MDLISIVKECNNIVQKYDQEYTTNPQQLATDIERSTNNFNSKVLLTNNKLHQTVFNITKDLCIDKLTTWCRCNRNKCTWTNIENTEDYICEMKRATNITSLRNATQHLVNSTIERNTCNGNCSTVVPDKEISSCLFTLSDINTLSIFTSIGIVDVLNSIAYIYIGLDTDKLVIDMTTSYVTCGGIIKYNPVTKECPSTLANIKEVYMVYIGRWCTINYSKVFEYSLLKSSIDKVIGANSINEIYTITGIVLDTLNSVHK